WYESRIQSRRTQTISLIVHLLTSRLKHRLQKRHRPHSSNSNLPLLLLDVNFTISPFQSFQNTWMTIQMLPAGPMPTSFLANVIALSIKIQRRENTSRLYWMITARANSPARLPTF